MKFQLAALIIALVFGHNAFAFDRDSWDKLLATQANDNATLSMLQERHIALPNGGERLYISTLIHRFLSLRGQPYFGVTKDNPTNYDRFHSNLIASLNDELNQKNQSSYARLRNLLSQTKVNHDYNARTVIEYQLCRLLSRMGEHHSAKFYCNSARSHLEQMDDPFIPLRDLYRLTANNHDYLGNYELALNDYFKVIDQAKSYHDNSGIYNDVGNLLTDMGEYEQALKYLSLSYDQRSHGNTLPLAVAQVIHSLANLYYEMGDYDVSLEHYDKSLVLLKQLDHQYGITLAYIGLGKLHTKYGNHDLSNAYLHQALDMASEQNNRAMTIEITLYLSHAYQARKLNRVAIEYAQTALEYAQNDDIYIYESKALLQLSDLFELDGQLDLALEYYKQFHKLEVDKHTIDNRNAFEALDLSKSRLVEELENSKLVLKNTSQRLELDSLQRQNLAYGLFIALLGITITAMIYANKKVRRLADHDALTHALSRMGAVANIRAQSSISKPSKKHVLVLFDLDKFKLINDAYGHPTGDRALKHVVQSINQHLNQNEFIGRLGGEEFVVFLTDVAESDVRNRVEMLRMAISSQPLYSEDEAPIHLSASFSFLATSENLAEFDVLYSILDQALYQAKQNGRDCVIDAYHDPVDVMPYAASRPVPA
ncbi:diguanylate cyclase [Vibrio tapetis subsp. quintayensis]|uniref:tetratricopeptide repeat-containing diguanylate cyclase n=1 Tax=Vibrio tapetis TaxID=52443 RepID=UPI0025B499BD|nr:diguanylate cyclase [Vibrio tapetis]MDN3682582.1 diguanylate cyclase [Vibrio tapetis subsp. quintayensis]